MFSTSWKPPSMPGLRNFTKIKKKKKAQAKTLSPASGETPTCSASGV